LRWFCLDYVCLKWYRFISTTFVWSGTDSSRLCLLGVVPIHLDYVCLEWYRFVSTMFVWSGTDSSPLCLFGVVPFRLTYVCFKWYRFVSTMYFLIETILSQLCLFWVASILSKFLLNYSQQKMLLLFFSNSFHTLYVEGTNNFTSNKPNIHVIRGKNKSSLSLQYRDFYFTWTA
jgi:hypothetical protein